jgi:hypothetical protein
MQGLWFESNLEVYSSWQKEKIQKNAAVGDFEKHIYL